MEKKLEEYYKGFIFGMKLLKRKEKQSDIGRQTTKRSTTRK